jgi:diguanylate cyclase (GGDEF)-like protein/PAS domain S-box-containing protein
MNWSSHKSHLYRSILIYGVLGILITSLLVALVSIIPFSLRLKSSSEDRISVASATKAEAISARLADFQDIADQIASRSAVRDELIAYSKGQVTSDQLIAYNQPKLLDAFQQSRVLAGVQQLDAQGNLLVQIGQPVPNELVDQYRISPSNFLSLYSHPSIIQEGQFLLTARTILDKEKNQVGAELILFKPDKLNQIVGDMLTIGESAVVVVGTKKNGFEYFFSSRKLTQEEKIIHHEAVAQLDFQNDVLWDPRSTAVMIAVTAVKGNDWFVIVQIDKDELYAEVRTQILRVTGLAILLAILGTSGMTILLSPLARGILVRETELENLVLEKADQYQAEYEDRLAIEQDLRLLSSRYQSVVQTARDAIILADPQGRIIDWNSAAEIILGYSADEMIGQNLLKIIPDRVKGPHQFAFQSFINDPELFRRRSRGQWLAQRKNGSEFPADISLSLFEMNGEKHIAAILRDMSELKNMEQALEQSQARYKSLIEDVVDATTVAICITDSQFHVVWENLSAVKMWDLDRNQIIGKDKRELLKEQIVGKIENGNDFVEKVLNSYVMNQHLADLKIHFPAKDGRGENWAIYSSKPIQVGFYAGGRIEQYVDITEQQNLLTTIERLAITDELTGIYNRRGLYELGNRDIARACRMNTPLSSIFLDVDHFKKLNDTYGHFVGDLVLKELALRIQGHTRDMDLVARYGGEEFVILLPDIPIDQAAQIAERMRCIIANMPIETKESTLDVTVSIGVAQLNIEKEDLASFIQKADNAMYQAKQNGRNRVELSSS